MKRELRDFARYITSTPVQVGMRLCLACMLMLVGNVAWAAGVLVAPIATPWSTVLGLTAEQEKDQTELLTKVKAAAKTEVESVVKAFNEDGEKKIEALVEKKVQAFKDQFKDMPLDKMKQAVADMEEMNKAVADLKAKQAATTPRNRKENLIQKALKEHWDEMQKAFKSVGNNSKSYGFKLERKFQTSASFGDRVIFGFRESGIDTAALPEAFILDLIQVMSGGPGSNPLSWIERNKVVDVGPPAYVTGPETVAEQGTKPNMKWAWVEKKVSASTIAAMVPITKQAVYNYPLLEQEIRGELLREFAIVIQQKILKGEGDGTGDDVKGLFEYAIPFAAGEFAGEVQDANEYDVIVAAATQILNANFVPSMGLITHNTKGLMSTRKATDGHYVLPPFSTVDGLNVYGVKLKSTNVLTDQEFLIMDPSRALWNWVENPQIEVGYINDDFAKNIWRLRVEAQGMLRVKEHERPAFVKGDFTTAKGLIAA
jgi:HK97 family phage major capsid protein